jgi:hypothetical protein
VSKPREAPGSTSSGASPRACNLSIGFGKARSKANLFVWFRLLISVESQQKPKLTGPNTSNLFCQNYKKVVEDLVQVVSSQEKELATKSARVADLQQQLENSGNSL